MQLFNLVWSKVVKLCFFLIVIFLAACSPSSDSNSDTSKDSSSTDDQKTSIAPILQTPDHVTSDKGISFVVKNAESRALLEDVTVKVSNACVGSSCSSPRSIYGKSDDSGLFTNSLTASLFPVNGNEAIKIEVIKTGYVTLVKYVKPRYDADGKLYLGDVYLCAKSSTDSDNDTMCDAAEEVHQTSAYNDDSDGDGLSDTAELHGVSGIDLPSYGANPLRKNIFLELDAHVQRVHSSSDIDMLVRAFADAPIKNLDGSTGVSLYVDHTERLPSSVVDLADLENDYIESSSKFWDHFDEKIKSKHFNVRRQGIFHYGVTLPSLPKRTFGGLSRGIVADDFVSNNVNIATVMHELGHNLGLTHGGGYGNRNYAPNYFSVMNYLYPYGYLTSKSSKAVMDFSRVRVDGFNESSFDEVSGFDSQDNGGELELSLYKVKTKTKGIVANSASDNIDANKDGKLERNASIDVDGVSSTNKWSQTQNDWESLRYRGGRFSGDSYLSQAYKSFSDESHASMVHGDEPCPAE
ncbi:MAG: hypothetical protein AAGF06_05450 [Pseudomonadota bacterium]